MACGPPLCLARSSLPSLEEHKVPTPCVEPSGCTRGHVSGPLQGRVSNQGPCAPVSWQQAPLGGGGGPWRFGQPDPLEATALDQPSPPGETLVGGPVQHNQKVTGSGSWAFSPGWSPFLTTAGDRDTSHPQVVQEELSRAGAGKAGHHHWAQSWGDSPPPPHCTLLQGRLPLGLPVEGLRDAGRPRKPLVREARGRVRVQGSEAGVPEGYWLRPCGPGIPACWGRQLWHTPSVQGCREWGAPASSLATGSPAPHSLR